MLSSIAASGLGTAACLRKQEPESLLKKTGAEQKPPELRVNFLDYWEVSKKRERRFSWITDIPITPDNAVQIMRGGRARCVTGVC